MKTKLTITSATRILGVAALTVITAPALVAQPAVPAPPPVPAPVIPPPTPPPAPPVTVAPPAVPAPGIPVNIGVPDSYAWDGYEYVGVIGNQYYYLGPGNVWMALPPDRLPRFRLWERDHHDWRDHAIHNELYRRDASGHDHPWHDHDGDHHDHDGH